MKIQHLYKDETAYRAMLERERNSALGRLLVEREVRGVIGHLGVVEEKYTYSVAFTRPTAWQTLYYQGLAHAYVRLDRRHSEQSIPAVPALSQVMRALIADAQSVESYCDFEEWADDLGYERDSLTAYKTYKECVAVRRRLPGITRCTLAELYVAVETDDQ